MPPITDLFGVFGHNGPPVSFYCGPPIPSYCWLARAVAVSVAVIQGIRCIAFCKTHRLVEWNSGLRTGTRITGHSGFAIGSDPTSDGSSGRQNRVVLSRRLQDSRLEERQRRPIGQNELFQNLLLGDVVGMSALELGVDIGGVDLTLYCGFPSSQHASLLQQAGRHGRGKVQLNRPSFIG
jgi:DEAD/DEAH box helicase domain-containing protein